MLPIGIVADPAEQSVLGCASMVASDPMRAKVGEAVRPSQQVASWGRRVAAFAWFAAEDGVNVASPIFANSRPSRERA